MDSPLQEPGSDAALIADVVDGSCGPVVRQRLDDLLRWLTAPGDARNAGLNVELQRRGVEEEQARSLAMGLLDAMLFSHPNRAPYRLLGLLESASPVQIRERYRLLMRVYHPDFAPRGSDWHNDRAARLNEAHCRLLESAGASSRPSAASVSHARPRRRSSRRRSFRWVRSLRAAGTARELRQRCLLLLVLLGAATVTQVFLTNRTWERWSSAEASPTTSQRGSR